MIKNRNIASNTCLLLSKSLGIHQTSLGLSQIWQSSKIQRDEGLKEGEDNFQLMGGLVKEIRGGAGGFTNLGARGERR